MSIPEANRSSSKLCRFWGSAITVTSLLPSRHNGNAQYRSATLRGTNFSTLSSTVADPQSTYRRPVTCSRAATRSSLDTKPRPSRSSQSTSALIDTAEVRTWEFDPKFRGKLRVSLEWAPSTAVLIDPKDQPENRPG